MHVARPLDLLVPETETHRCALRELLPRVAPAWQVASRPRYPAAAHLAGAGLLAPSSDNGEAEGGGGHAMREVARLLTKRRQCWQANHIAYFWADKKINTIFIDNLLVIM